MPKDTENKKDVVAGFRIDATQQAKIKAIAYWERKSIKDVAAEAFDDYIKKYEKKNGEIQLPPTK